MNYAYDFLLLQCYTVKFLVGTTPFHPPLKVVLGGKWLLIPPYQKTPSIEWTFPLWGGSIN